MISALSASSFELDRFNFLIYQFGKLTKQGKPRTKWKVKMIEIPECVPKPLEWACEENTSQFQMNTFISAVTVEEHEEDNL